MALTCSAGYYFDSKTKECRDCEYVCGAEYGGPELLECKENCPGYGVSTTVAAVNDSGSTMWIILGLFGLALILTCAVIVLCCIKKKCTWWSTPKPFVTEETKEGLVGKSVISA